jgi:hypothetical protein
MAALPEQPQRQICHFGAPPLVHAEVLRLIQIRRGCAHQPTRPPITHRATEGGVA